MTTVSTCAHASGQPNSAVAEPSEWEAPAENAPRTAVLMISRMPRTLRPALESTMAYTLTSAAGVQVQRSELLSAELCTRWQRDRAVTGGYALCCRQLISGVEAELHDFARAVHRLADEHDFSGSVRLLDEPLTQNPGI